MVHFSISSGSASESHVYPCANQYVHEKFDSLCQDLRPEIDGAILCDDPVCDNIRTSELDGIISELDIHPLTYFFKSEPVFCVSDPICEVNLLPRAAPFSSCSQFYDVSREVSYDRPCGYQCTGIHYVGGRRNQLNPCVFFDYCFSFGDVDERADFIFTSVKDGFRIVDDGFEGSYLYCNYDSALGPSARSKMDSIIVRELELEKLTLVDEIPDCVHALGAISKSDGDIRPITDCRRPLGVSINSYMNEVCQEFSYISLDQVTAVMTPGCFFSVLDIKWAYRSVSVFPDHRRCQGLLVCVSD